MYQILNNVLPLRKNSDKDKEKDERLKAERESMCGKRRKAKAGGRRGKVEEERIKNFNLCVRKMIPAIFVFFMTTTHVKQYETTGYSDRCRNEL
ncbi:MAG: hypothetical protein ACM3UT_14555 [Chloroflexota bacterium]